MPTKRAKRHPLRGLVLRAAFAAALAIGYAGAGVAAPGDILFRDNLNGNLNDWTVTGEAAVTGDTAEQGNALRIGNGFATVVSDPIDAAVPAATFTVWIRRGDDAFSEDPDDGEDLRVEYRDAGGTWNVLETFPGGGTPGEIFSRSYDLPADALHANLSIRFVVTDGSFIEIWPLSFSNDYWHIDNPTIVETGSATPSSGLLYSFEEPLWTGAGGEIEEAGGSGVNGTAAGGAANDDAMPAIATNPGTCRYGVFDGTDDYIEIADHAALDMTDELTVAAWIYVRSLPPDLYTIVSKDTNYEFHVNDSGRIYWWWGADEFRTDDPISLNEWHHVAITFRRGRQRIYVDGRREGSNNYGGTLQPNDLPLFIGTDWNFLSRAFDGFIDEVRILPEELSQNEVRALMRETHECVTTAPRFSINHDGYGIHCAQETIVVDVVDATAGTPLLGYDATVELDTQSGRGTWMLIAGGGAFSDATADDGLATYDWPLGESQAVFALQYPEGPPSIDIDVVQTTDPGIRDTAAEGLLTFSPSGFTLTAAPLPNPPGAIIPFTAAQTAGVEFPVHITAYGQTPDDPVCGVIESYDGPRDLEFWFDHVDPATGTLAIAVEGVGIAAAESGAAPQTVPFTNGQAFVNVLYKDVGSVHLYVKDDTTGNPDLPTGMRGATNDFVVRPYDLVLSGIVNAAGTANDPTVDAADDAVFTAAGAPFSVTVTAVDADGDPTPNFGREASPETVRLDVAVFAPAGGSNPPVVGATGFGPFSNGSATGVDFVWNEVGIMQMSPAIGDGDYLGTGDVIGSLSERVGRFIPDHFSATLNNPRFETACAAGGFTYQGEAFGYRPGAEPVITIEARSASGGVTQNYTGAFFRISTATLANRTYTASGGTLDASALPAPTADPVVTEIAPGRGTLTFSSGGGLAFARSAPAAPFDADIRLSIDVVDADGVEAAGIAPLGNPVTFGAGGGIAFDAGSEIRYGRIRLGNAFGSELVSLPVPAVVEHYAGDAVGFVVNAADVCTGGVNLSLSGFTENLAAGETCALDAGSPGASGIGCAAPSPLPQRFEAPPAAGDFNLNLAAPGAGNAGGAVVSATVPAWLRFDWNAAAPGEEDPAAQVTFGLYDGGRAQIYLREVY